MTSSASVTPLESTTSKVIFHQKNFLVFGSSLTPKRPIKTNKDPFLWNGSSKIHFSLISDTLSVECCCLFCFIYFVLKHSLQVLVKDLSKLLRPADVTFLKNGCGTQNSRTIIKPNLTCLSLSVRANSQVSL